jgi:methylglutaconyl-CoA hydratase
VAVCDVVVAAAGTLFGMTEVRIGLIPSVISSFVVRKIGESHARAWCVTGERYDAEEARRVGLVHQVVPEAELDEAVQETIDSILLGGPQALAEAKKLARTVSSLSAREVQTITVQRISERRVSAEGLEGMRAFLERRLPKWTEKPKPAEKA